MAEVARRPGCWPRTRFLTWMDMLWLIFLAGLAVLPPVGEIHKQMILAALAVFQLLETRLLAGAPRRGAMWAVLIKLALATLLIGHTGQIAINSSYYPIFYIPVVTAAMLFGPWGTLGWTALASAAYCSYLWPALEQYRLVPAALDELARRIFFFFLLALIINRFVMETRRQRDLLLRAQAETKRAERLAALGQLSAGLAHEIRNPLAVIKGSAEMLATASISSGSEARELAGYISSEVNRVNVLVTRFLDFARPLKLQQESVELASLLDRALGEAEERWPGAGVRIERTYAHLPKMTLDATMIERVFANLAANAFEAMAQPHLEAARRCHEQSGHSLPPIEARPPATSGSDPAKSGKPLAAAAGVLQVSTAAAQHGTGPGAVIQFRDSGPGVPGELREQIFNPFFTTKPTGVGLGLAIVAKIIDQHGGYVRLRDGAGDNRGATFEVFLPYVHHPDRG